MAIVSAALPEESRLLHTLGLLASGLARQPVGVYDDGTQFAETVGEQ